MLRIGWKHTRTKGSHKLLELAGRPPFPFAFHDGEEIGPRMLAQIGKRTGLRPEDL
ncbi:MAG: type II toxin-antitoxin system HicA family toxin [Vicinamibacteria bacterium]|nr:type II toxin-antitoxin system HicA family toxin [Vicinamibacteria bacterium]